MRAWLIRWLMGESDTQFEAFVRSYGHRINSAIKDFPAADEEMTVSHRCKLLGLLAELRGYLSTEYRRQQERTPMTPTQKQRIAEIEERLARATPGPWRIGVLMPLGQNEIFCGEPAYETGIATSWGINPKCEENTALIAAAPDDLRFLLELVKEIDPLENCGCRTCRERKEQP